jgi:undecaprenyl-diphosphatase
MLTIDLNILYFFNVTLSAPWLDSVMIYLTNLQHWMPVYILAFGYLIFKFKWRGVRMVIACLLLVGVADFVTNKFIKELIARPRPCSLVSDPGGLYSWLRTPDGPRWGYSFPSSHAANNFAGVVFFILLFPKKKSLFWLFVPATIVSISRIYLGLHYPSDLLGGMIIGALFGWIFALMYKKVEEKYFSGMIILRKEKQ